MLWEPELAPTGALFQEAVEHVGAQARPCQGVSHHPAPGRPGRGGAALDTWAGSDVDWRGELRRYYEEHIPVRVRPGAAVNATLRRLHTSGVRLVWASPGPAEATEVLLHHLGVARLIDGVVIATSAASAASSLGLTDAVLVENGLDELLALAGETAVPT